MKMFINFASYPIFKINSLTVIWNKKNGTLSFVIRWFNNVYLSKCIYQCLFTYHVRCNYQIQMVKRTHAIPFKKSRNVKLMRTLCTFSNEGYLFYAKNSFLVINHHKTVINLTLLWGKKTVSEFCQLRQLRSFKITYFITIIILAPKMLCPYRNYGLFLHPHFQC